MPVRATATVCCICQKYSFSLTDRVRVFGTLSRMLATAGSAATKSSVALPAANEAPLGFHQAAGLYLAIAVGRHFYLLTP